MDPHCIGTTFIRVAGLFLQNMASVNALIKVAFSAAGARGLGCGGRPQHNGIGTVCPHVGCITGVTKSGAILVVVLKGLMGMLQDAAWLLLTFCGTTDCGIGLLRAGIAWNSRAYNNNIAGRLPENSPNSFVDLHSQNSSKKDRAKKSSFH